MSRKEAFEHESIQDHHTILAYFSALMEGFQKNRISFSTEDRQIVLYPANLIEFSLKAKKKGDKSKITLSFSWKDISEGEASESEKFTILS